MKVSGFTFVRNVVKYDYPVVESIRSVLPVVDEFIVVDSHSTDRTAAISREFTNRVYQVDFKGFGNLRNQAVALTTHKWVFSLDSDERMALSCGKRVGRCSPYVGRGKS